MIKLFENFEYDKYILRSNGYYVKTVKKDEHTSYNYYKMDGKLSEIDLIYYNKSVGNISFGYIEKEYTGSESEEDKKFTKLVKNQVYVWNVSVFEQLQKKGIATDLYNKAILELKDSKYTRLYSGKTRNSTYVNNIWNKIADGYYEIGDVKIYYKNL